MAKQQITNYVFKPGIGASGNKFPDAWSLLEQNKDFLISESIAYINQEIVDAVKCQRDIGYILDGAMLDAITGTNYNAIFLGLTEVNSLDVSKTVLRTIQRAGAAAAQMDFAGNATFKNRFNAAISTVLDIAENGRDAAPAISFPNSPTGYTGANAARDKILNNLTFLEDEINAWVNVTYPNHNHDVDKCTRDVKYALWAVAHDLTYGGNSASYDSAKFFYYFSSNTSVSGITAEHRAQTVAAYRRLQSILPNIIQGIAITPSVGNTSTQVTGGTNGSSANGTTASGLIDIIADVVESGTSALPGTRSLPAVVSLVGTEYETTWNEYTGLKTSFITGTTWSPSYTYNQSKCERDLGYVLDAYIHDLRYGGNEKLRNVIKYYWDQDVAQIDGNRIPEVDTHLFIGDLITDYLFTNTAWDHAGLLAQITDTTKNGSDVYFTPTNAVYTPTTGNLVLTIGSHSILPGDNILIQEESLVFTCGLDNFASTHAYPRSSGVPNSTGTDPYYNQTIYVESVTSNTITVNVGISSNTSTHVFSSANADAVRYGPMLKIKELVANTVNVITNGLSSMPQTVPTGVGTIKIQGRHPASELLLITNATKNEIIYNFTNPATGGTVSFKEHGTDETDFVTFLQATDAVTTIDLNYDTSSHSSTDDLQIFIEGAEAKIRPYDFGTDAIERMRIAPPMSMLDADFEYGLQPTKWAAIGTLRGYPSLYEIPGTDTDVVSMSTDASDGTNGVGQSLITVETAAPHGFDVGTPISIKALEDSVPGANRAEGSFVITAVPSNVTFQYYAKAKVGDFVGQVLSTTYTQLRQSGFYTGANIGGPSFTVASNGSSGSLQIELGVLDNQDIITFDGNQPEIGSPLTGSTGLTAGTQVTSIRGTSAGGGEYLTPVILGDYPTNSNIITVEDATGVELYLGADRGDNYATHVIDITNNDLTFDSNFVTNIIGNKTTYTGVTGVNQAGIGIGATFDISRANGIYNTVIATVGQDYYPGDRIIIFGTALGGQSPANDLTIQVDSVDAQGGITSFTDTGAAFDGVATVVNPITNIVGGNGTNLNIDVTYANNLFTGYSINNAGDNYVVNDRVTISGQQLSPIGIDGTNDLIATVSAVDSSGSVVSLTLSGAAPQSEQTYFNPTNVVSGSGNNHVFEVVRQGTGYVVNFFDGGQNFLVNDTIEVPGNLLGGATPTNDCTITVDSIGISGDITSWTASGVAVDSGTATNLNTNNLIGQNFACTIDIAAGSYAVTINNAGEGYGVGQSFTILGSELYGLDGVNDLEIEITSTGSSGDVLGVTSIGTAVSGTGTYNGISGQNEESNGSNASFIVYRANGIYDTVTVNNPGSNYVPGNRILIAGTQLGGISPENDLIITVQNTVGGGITGINTSFDSASEGTQLRLISSITVSEAAISPIVAGTQLNFSAIATIEVTFPYAHGLVPGNTFITAVESDDGNNKHYLANGSFFVTEIPDINVLRYTARAPGTINTTGDPIIGNIYPRPDSFFIHRPYDGGVQLGTGGPQHGSQAIRQSKKYIRYQSGKGIMYTTGALFAPSYDLRSVEADGIEVGSTITVVTDDNDHGLQVGGVIRLLGIETPGYNSGYDRGTPPDFDYEVIDVDDERTFKIRAKRRLGATSAVLGFAAQMSVVSWHGATVRSGIFDDQNGIYWEYDGTNLSVNQRTGTKQIAGTISLSVDSNLLQGTNTRFRDQLQAGDRIVIKGMTHVVSHVVDQTTAYISPDWRGVVDISGIKANLVVDKKVKQQDFNLDRLDGTGPSGYDIDIAKMQMIGIQYSWYGAGFIDFMLRGSDGNFVFCHRMRNSNVNTEAFMRSGNLPVRYEVTNEGPPGKLAADMDSSQTYVDLVDASFFPNTGVIYIDNEIIRFTGKTGNRLTGCSRNHAFSNFQAGANRTYTAGPAATHTARTGVILISQTITPLISHWGSAFLTDGGFDEDRGYIFSYAESGIDVSTLKQTAFLIRLAPSVSNAVTGNLGERELLNRAQLLLQGIEVTSDSSSGGIVIEGVLNPSNYPVNPGDVSWSGLSTKAQGGQPSFAQIAAGGSIKWTSAAVATTASVTTSNNLDTGYVYTRLNCFNQEQQSPWQFDRTSYNSFGSPYYATAGVTEVYTNNPNSMNPWYVNSFYSEIGTPQGSIDTADANKVLFGASSSNGNTSLSGGNRLLTSTTLRFVYPAPSGFTNKILITDATMATANLTQGQRIDVTETKFPANTSISNIEKIQNGPDTAWLVTLNNTSIQAISPGQSVVFTEGSASFAEPGETVFSFIANTGERSSLDLAQLKELTNTPLGGRGTYPNGPDVLAINVYKVTGTNTKANIILRWGEAQA